jgi:hypothetical protein
MAYTGKAYAPLRLLLAPAVHQMLERASNIVRIQYDAKDHTKLRVVYEKLM